MKSKNLEQRVSELESQVSALLRSLNPADNAKPRWERIAGTFENDPTYKKAMQLGKEYRESLRPVKRPRGKRQTMDMFVLDADHLSLLEWSNEGSFCRHD